MCTVEQMTRIHDHVARLIYSNASLRPPLQTLSPNMFANDLQTISEFLDELPQKNDEEREAFFK